MKISNYIPTMYSNNTEMTNIYNAEEDEFEDNLKPKVNIVFKDTFIKTASESGIAKFEELFNITPNDTDTVEDRRNRIIYRLNSHIPFTETYLVSKLQSLLGNNFTYILDAEECTLTINITSPGKSALVELNNILNNIVPCNMEITVIPYSINWQTIYENNYKWNNLTEMTWQDVMDGEWI